METGEQYRLLLHLNEMKSADSIYVFFSSNFFKQMVNLGISDINTKDLFNFRFQNTTSPESGCMNFLPPTR
ncbi:putative fimbrial protein [Escherichia coli]|uniref:Putative fimbrial protein n=1 Tax=Escherichia coli TaxID=562 RepID=A0A377DJF5_ECOLX|nr:putative fimbrial protein [Escherichia coli]